MNSAVILTCMASFCQLLLVSAFSTSNLPISRSLSSSPLITSTLINTYHTTTSIDKINIQSQSHTFRRYNNILNAIRIPNLFNGGNDRENSNSEKEFKLPSPPSEPPKVPRKFSGTVGVNTEALFANARNVISTDLAIEDESIIDDDFIWIGPSSGDLLGKKEYLAAGKFFDLRSTFPDLEYRAHDFRLDSRDPLTVRLTARVVGTMRGDLGLRRETLPANGKRMICPPEAISMTFNPDTGKLVKLCTGFTMDRLVGNTNGLCGVMGAAAFAGRPPSELDIFPPIAVIQRFFGRPVKQLSDEQSSFLAPFPESVMIQLAKGIIAADLGASDPDLLSPSFTFTGPIVGPLRKDEFIKSFGGFNIKGGFPDIYAECSNFRVDPYDPYRVWLDSRSSGTRTGEFAGAKPTGLRFDGPPEAISFAFDDDGVCTRLTAGAVMDPSQGNTGGLGGVFGILYATGTPLPGIATRPLPDLISRLQKRVLLPITKIDVDEFVLPEKEVFSLVTDNVSGAVSGVVKVVKPSEPATTDNIKPPPKSSGNASSVKSQTYLKPTPNAKSQPRAPPINTRAKAPAKPKPSKVTQDKRAKKDKTVKPQAAAKVKKTGMGSQANKAKADEAARIQQEKIEKELQTKKEKEKAAKKIEAIRFEKGKAKNTRANITKKGTAVAPKGIPPLSRWRKN